MFSSLNYFLASMFMVMSFVMSTVHAATLDGDTNRPGMSLYQFGEKVQLTFKATGLNPQVKDLKLVLDIVDEADKTAHRLSSVVTPDDQGNWTGTVDAPSGRLGFYRVRAKLSNGLTIPNYGGHADRPAGFLTYAIVPDPAQRHLYASKDTVFGMQGGFNRDLYEVLPYLGIRWTLGATNWKNLERDYPGQILDKWKKARQQGEKFPLNAFESCSFKTQDKDMRWQTYRMACGLGSCCLPSDWKVPPYKPETFAIGRGTLTKQGEKDFEIFCRTLAKARVESYPDMDQRIYEVTWEPDLFFKGTPADIVRYYEIAYPAIHQVDPKAVIAGVAMGAKSSHDLQYIEDMFKAGLGKCIDMFSLHYTFIGEGFERRYPAQRIRDLKRMIKSYTGKDIPLINTEFGMNTKANDGADQLRSSQQEIRAHLISLGEGFRHILAFYVVGMDGGYFYNLRPKVKWGPNKICPRPLAPAYAAMTWLLEGHKGGQAIDWLGETAKGYAYENDEDVTLALWDHSDQPTQVVLPIGVLNAEVYDWMGNRTIMPTDNGALRLTLGNSPIYIKGVSPKLWGSKALKALDIAKPEIQLFPGEKGAFGCDIKAVFSKPIKGRLSFRAPDGIMLSNASVRLDIPTGSTKSMTVNLTVSGDLPEGNYPISLILEEGNTVTDAAGCVVKVRNPVKIGQIKPFFDSSGNQGMQITLQNLRQVACTGKIQLNLVGVPETRREIPFVLAAHANKQLSVLYHDLAVHPERKYDVQVRVILDKGNTVTTSFKTNFMAIPHLSKTMIVDGSKEKWRNIPSVTLRGLEDCLRSPKYYSGDSAQMRFAWDKFALYMRVEVHDDVQFQEHTEGMYLWEGDALQCGFCLEPWKEFQETADPLADSFNRPTQTEINLSLTPKGAMAYRYMLFPPNQHKPNGVLSDKDMKLVITRNGQVTIYEAAFPWTTLGLQRAPVSGEHIALTIAVNDRDQPRSMQPDPSALSLFDGATAAKDRNLMGILYLAK